MGVEAESVGLQAETADDGSSAPAPAADLHYVAAFDVGPTRSTSQSCGLQYLRALVLFWFFVWLLPMYYTYCHEYWGHCLAAKFEGAEACWVHIGPPTCKGIHSMPSYRAFFHTDGVDLHETAEGMPPKPTREDVFYVPTANYYMFVANGGCVVFGMPYEIHGTTPHRRWRQVHVTFSSLIHISGPLGGLVGVVALLLVLLAIAWLMGAFELDEPWAARRQGNRWLWAVPFALAHLVLLPALLARPLAKGPRYLMLFGIFAVTFTMIERCLIYGFTPFSGLFSRFAGMTYDAADGYRFYARAFDFEAGSATFAVCGTVEALMQVFLLWKMCQLARQVSLKSVVPL